MKPYKPDPKRLAQLEGSKKDLFATLMEHADEKTARIVKENLGIQSGADVSLENIFPMENNLSRIKLDKEGKNLIDKIKKALIAELDETHNTYFGLQKRVFHKAYLKETNKSVRESARIGSWEKTLKMSVAFTAKGHSSLTMNFLQSLTDIDIEADIGKEMPQAMKDFFFQLNGNERIQLYQATNAYEIKEVIYPLLLRYIRTYIEPLFTDNIIKELSLIIPEKIKAISTNYSLAKKSKHAFQSRTHIKEGIESYFKE